MLSQVDIAVRLRALSARVILSILRLQNNYSDSHNGSSNNNRRENWRNKYGEDSRIEGTEKRLERTLSSAAILST